MHIPAPRRTRSMGFVLSSNNEWVKAAYYDPKHGGTDSYWAYPTDPFHPPEPFQVESQQGDVVNASNQPLATYNPHDPNSSVDTPGSPPGAAPTWCPSQAGPSCGKVFPADVPQGLDLPSQYMANVSTVGQAKTPSPWAPRTKAAMSSRSLTRSRRNRRDTTSCGTGGTTTVALPMRRPTRSRSRRSATSRGTRPLSASIPGWGSAWASSETSNRSNVAMIGSAAFEADELPNRCWLTPRC
jgi:hypothetical protein